MQLAIFDASRKEVHGFSYGAILDSVWNILSYNEYHPIKFQKNQD